MPQPATEMRNWDRWSPNISTEEFPSNKVRGCSFSSIELPNALPQTIEDSIALVLALGFEYLWVDSIYLTEDDLGKPTVLTAVMASVYEGAYFTIIAAAGGDAEAGLPGVMPNSRNTQQHIEVVNDMRLVIAMPSLKQQLVDSKWASRAWTYQEGIMCQRYIIFTAEQIYWECGQAGYCEAVEEPLKDFRDMNVQPSFSRVLGNSFMKGSDFDEVYFRLVSEYSKRQLTYGGDGLRAFSGLLRHLKVLFAVDFLFGIPNKTVPEFFLWNHQVQLGTSPSVCRRESIPSWTWAGWSGPVEFKIREERTRPGIKFGFGSRSGNNYCAYLALVKLIPTRGGKPLNGSHAWMPDLKWDPLFWPAGFSWSQDSTDEQILVCETRTAPFKLIEGKYGMEIECTFDVNYLKDPPLEGHKKIRHGVEVFMDCNPVNFKKYDKQVVEVMECGRFCKLTPLISTSCFLLLSWDGEIASRIGVGSVCSRAFENANPVRKVIRLR